jgi:hypothetical protein
MSTPSKQDIATVNKHFADGARPTFLPKWMRERVVQLLADVREEERERCAKLVDAEEEFPGLIPQDVLIALLRDPEECARAIVRVTKKSIARALRARGDA